MATTKTIKNEISRTDFDSIFEILSDNLIIKGEYKNVSYIQKKEEVLEIFAEFLENFLELKVLNSSQQKLQFINLIDKLNMQKEALELQKGNIDLVQVKEAGQRLGRKAQSAFKLKQ